MSVLFRLRARCRAIIGRRSDLGLLGALAIQEGLFAVGIWKTGALPRGVRELHSLPSILSFATGSLTAVALLGLAGFAWLSVVNLVPWRALRRFLSLLLYFSVYLPVFNLGFYLFSHHLADIQLLRDAPTYFGHAPVAHLLGLLCAVLIYFSVSVGSWRLWLFGEAWRDLFTESMGVPLRETLRIAVIAAAGLVLSSVFYAEKRELGPNMATAGHLITAWLPNTRMALPPSGGSEGGFIRAMSVSDTSGLLPVGKVETYLSALRDNTPPGRPNILIVMLESVPTDHVSAYGYHRQTTPNLDELAKQSLVFDRCWSVANESKHGQSSIHVSMLPMRGNNDDFSRVDYKRVPWWTVFKSLGYQTAYISTQNEEWLHMKSFQLDGQTPPDLYLHSLDMPEGPFYEGQLRKKDEETVNRRLFQYLDRAKSDSRPFVLMTNYQRTHYPFELPKNWTAPFTPLARLGEFRAWTADEIPNGINSFDSALAYVDKNLGELIRHLDETGLGKNTVVAVLSDHGIGFEPNVHPVSESLDSIPWRACAQPICRRRVDDRSLSDLARIARSPRKSGLGGQERACPGGGWMFPACGLCGQHHLVSALASHPSARQGPHRSGRGNSADFWPQRLPDGARVAEPSLGQGVAARTFVHPKASRSFLRNACPARATHARGGYTRS